MLLTFFTSKILRSVMICLSCVTIWLASTSVSYGDINNDRFDGNIFVVYAGNGSLVPLKMNFKQSLERKIPTILVYYLDDNSDSKQFAFLVSRLQEFYGRAANILPMLVDSIPQKKKYQKDEVGYYYRNAIPQIVVLDAQGKKIFDEIGQIPFEMVDDVLRKEFDLLPRSESIELKRKNFNQFNSELVPVEKSENSN